MFERIKFHIILTCYVPMKASCPTDQLFNGSKQDLVVPGMDFQPAKRLYHPPFHNDALIIKRFIVPQHWYIRQLYYIIIQVTWLVVTEVRSESFGLVTERRHYNGRHMLRRVFIVECGIARFLCAVRVFDVRASSSCPGPPLSKISFLSWPPLLN